jgi:hypothetical protein
VHISLHQLRDNIDVVEAGGRGRLEHINHVDDVVLVEELQQFDLTDDTLSIDEIFKRFTDFLNCNLTPTLVVIGRAYHTVSAVAHLLNVFVLGVDVEGSPYKTLDNHEHTYLSTQTSVLSPC